MHTQSKTTRFMAVTGSIFVWVPLILPFIFGLVIWPRHKMFRFDYLMPAELYPIVFVGGGLLLWAALRVRLYHRLIGAGLGTALFFLVAGQVLGLVTGLASGWSEAGSPWRVVVMGSIGIYALAAVVMGIAGVRLVRALFAKPAQIDKAVI